MKTVIAILAMLSAFELVAQDSGKAAPAMVSTQSGEVKVERMAKLDNPWGMAFLPDGRLLITEKPGRLRIYARGKLSPPIKGVPKVDYLAQGGLLDVEVDPAFARNQWVYLSYSERASQQPSDATEPGDARFVPAIDKTDITLKGGAVARGKLVGNQLRDVKVIWRQAPKMIGRGHFGHRLVFAPDGKLLITSGERMRFDPAQDLDGNLGKVVRINSDGSIPRDNPFFDAKDRRTDVWSLGHRNVLSAAINPTSKQLWIVEMGPKNGDELNIVTRRSNYGWPVVSNGDNYDDSPIPDHATDRGFEAPIRSWTPVISPSGLLFYSGDLFSAWRGNALMGGLSSKALIRMTLDGNQVTGEERINMGERIRDVIQASDGSVLMLVDGKDGALLRLTPSGQ